MKNIGLTVLFGLFFSFGMNAQVTESEAESLMLADYSAEDLSTMESDDPVGYAKLLYYYMNSWYVVEGDTPSTEYLNDKILITRFESQRHATDEVEITISAEGAKLVLKSQAAVDAKYAEIESEH